MKALLCIVRIWAPHAGWLIFGALLSVGAALLAVALMTLSAALVGVTLAGMVLAVPMALRVLGPARVVGRYLERLVTHDAMFRALADVRVWFFRGLAKRAATGLGMRHAGDMLSRLVADVEALDGLYLRILVPLCGALAMCPVLVWVVHHQGKTLTWLVGGLFVLAAFVLPGWAAWGSGRLGQRLSVANAALRVAVLDLVSGLREVRAFGAEERMHHGVREREAALLAAQDDQAAHVSYAGTGAFLCAQLALFLVLAWGGDGAETLTTAFLVMAVFEGVAGLSRAGALAGHASAAARRVVAVAQEPLSVPEPVHPAVLPQGHELSFQDVRFRWAVDRPTVFDALNLTIPAGARVALLGPSGAGKSSLAALALKAAQPEAGRVLMGGVDVASLSATDVRSRIAWLGQASHLFSDTIRANLLLGRADATEAELWAALDQAAIGDFVRDLPEQLDSWVGEAGTRFSGGQGRRLALARVLLSRAPILILDEPGVGLDAQTERAFLGTLNTVTKGRSVLLIAHRLHGIEQLDQIYRLRVGQAIPATA